jgi:hypothetical protein
MTKYRVRNQWWEGVVDADEMTRAVRERPELQFWQASDSPEGAELVGVVTATTVAVDQEHLLEDTVHAPPTPSRFYGLEVT